jgi:hypothetical protein
VLGSTTDVEVGNAVIAIPEDAVDRVDVVDLHPEAIGDEQVPRLRVVLDPLGVGGAEGARAEARHGVVGGSVQAVGAGAIEVDPVLVVVGDKECLVCAVEPKARGLAGERNRRAGAGARAAPRCRKQVLAEIDRHLVHFRIADQEAVRRGHVCDPGRVGARRAVHRGADCLDVRRGDDRRRLCLGGSGGAGHERKH